MTNLNKHQYMIESTRGGFKYPLQSDRKMKGLSTNSNDSSCYVLVSLQQEWQGGMVALHGD